ncbi:MAG: molybdopterin-dependent oxidoreductase [Bauldia sp.]|nr:molybdopterin-dependent oxidoreductase [Bauldia sp.]
MSRLRLDRRRFLALSGAGAAGLLLSGCDAVSRAPWFRDLAGQTDKLTQAAQRLVLGPQTLAREFPESAISSYFRANGNTDVANGIYHQFARTEFVDYPLPVEGLVSRPKSFTMAELKAYPQRTQITRHDCVEGWSCIGKWTGPALAHVLNEVGLQPNARYVVFHCWDTFATFSGSVPYYESIDLEDAFHPQTILAHEMNGAPLTIPHGAPLRLRVERQLGYKHAKFVRSIEVVESFDQIHGGQGGYYEDINGYEWYAGI